MERAEVLARLVQLKYWCVSVHAANQAVLFKPTADGGPSPMHILMQHPSALSRINSPSPSSLPSLLQVLRQARASGNSVRFKEIAEHVKLWLLKQKDDGAVLKALLDALHVDDDGTETYARGLGMCLFGEEDEDDLARILIRAHPFIFHPCANWGGELVLTRPIFYLENELVELMEILGEDYLVMDKKRTLRVVPRANLERVERDGNGKTIDLKPKQVLNSPALVGGLLHFSSRQTPPATPPTPTLPPPRARWSRGLRQVASSFQRKFTSKLESIRNATSPKDDLNKSISLIDDGMPETERPVAATTTLGAMPPSSNALTIHAMERMMALVAFTPSKANDNAQEEEEEWWL